MAIFVTGATGFIGGAVAARFVADGYEVRGLVRDEEKAKQLAEKGITAVLGDLDDADLLAREACASEGVVNAADSDHHGAAMALLEGLLGSGKPLLHTSGTGLVAENTRGEASERIYDDDTPLVSDPVLGERANIDQQILKSADRKVRSIVLCNSCIYGWGEGLHRESIMVPWLKRRAQQDGAARFIGSGSNIWSNVHIDNLVDLYMLAFDKAPAGSRYLVENGESAFADISTPLPTASALARRSPGRLKKRPRPSTRCSRSSSGRTAECGQRAHGPNWDGKPRRARCSIGSGRRVE